jgi:hypothetical protein
MSLSQAERQRSVELLNSLAQQRYDLELLSVPDLVQVLKGLNPRLNERGKEFFTDIRDFLCIQNLPQATFAPSLEQAREEIDQLLTEIPFPIGYVTGALEMGFHHKIALEGLTVDEVGTFVIGLEGEEYIASKKGRRPLFSLQEKVSLWMRLGPKKSVLFAIPSKPEWISSDDYYDWITQYLGLFKNPRIKYFGSEDDSWEIVGAHHRRAFSPKHVLRWSVGNPPIHTSNLLKE